MVGSRGSQPTQFGLQSLSLFTFPSLKETRDLNDDSGIPQVLGTPLIDRPPLKNKLHSIDLYSHICFNNLH